MISEQITVTDTPTSIKALIETARSGASVPAKASGVMLRYDVDETAVVSLTDAGSSTGAVVLDANTESLFSTAFSATNIEQILLATASGTVTVHVIVEQRRI